MNRRFAFLAGQLSGIVIGAASVYAVFAFSKPAPNPSSPAVIPVSNLLLEPEDIKFGLPEGWQQREFNGSPYYIVPLSLQSNTAS